jgi:hypothetical protein
MKTEPNKSLQPTTMLVTDRAAHAPRQARSRLTSNVRQKQPMKTRILVLLAVLAIAWSSWLLGHSAGERRIRGLQQGPLVMGLAAAEAMREGKTDEALSRLESIVFSSAVILMEDAHWRQSFAVETVKPSLVQYRARYRSDKGAWTPAEHLLENLLDPENKK